MSSAGQPLQYDGFGEFDTATEQEGGEGSAVEGVEF